MKLKPKSTTKCPKALLYKRFIGLEKSENLQTIYNTTDGKFWTFDILEKKFSEIGIDKVPQGSKVVNVTLFSTVLSYQSFYFRYDGTKWLQTSTDGTSFKNNFSITVNTLPYGEAEYTDTNYTPILKKKLNPDGNDVYGYQFNITTPAMTKYTLTIYARNLYTGEEYVLFDIGESVGNVDFGSVRSRLYVSVDSIITKIYFKVENKSSVSRDISIYCEIEDGAISTSDIELLSGTFNNVAKYQTNKYYFVGSFDYMLKGSIESTTSQYVKGNIIPLQSFNIKHFDDDIKLTTDDLVVIEGHLYSVENPETDHKHQPKDYAVYFATLNSIL